MLVLVLILVVIALALVLAGLFLHIVALAWASVGISLLASLVLLYDWWQTRTAVRAGRSASGSSSHEDGDRERTAVSPAAGGAVGGGPAGPDGYGGADMEPATQVLPVVPSSAHAADETVVMPVVAPSGSAEAPSGASRSSGLSSRSVTDVTSDEGTAIRSVDGGSAAVGSAGSSEPAPVGEPATTVAASADGRPERPREAGADAAGAARVPEEGPGAGATTAVPAGSAPDGATQAVPAGGVVGGGAAAAGAAGAAFTGQPAGQPPADGAVRADRAPDEPTSVAAAVGSPPVDERTRGAEPVDMSGEAPEEPRDPAHASLVARLPDEVVVIDEHPRYHVQACPSLAGRPLIPLPVSEAVELGFTPCGWCAPNRTLSERHPAEAR